MTVWVPAIPVPYKGLRKRCVCGAKFWREQSYREHYVRAHGCHEENPEMTVEMDVSAAVRLGYGLWILRRAQRAFYDAADAADLAIAESRRRVADADQTFRKVVEATIPDGD